MVTSLRSVEETHALQCLTGAIPHPAGFLRAPLRSLGRSCERHRLDSGPRRASLTRCLLKKVTQANKAVQTTSKRMRSPTRVTPDQLANVLDTFEPKGIGGVRDLGHSPPHGYKLVARARKELGR
jgi:hypothetical protein